MPPPPPPPPPFPPPFSGPPPFRGFPSAGGPPPGGSSGGRLPAPPPPFPPAPFPTTPAGGLGLPSPPAYPPPPPPPPLLPPHLPPWPPPPPPPRPRPPPPAPERPLAQWRPEASPPLRRERAGPPLPPEAPAAPGGALRRDEPRGGGRGGGGGGDPWLSRFLDRLRGPPPPPPPSPSPPSGPAVLGPRRQAARVAAEALRLVARLSAQCGAWRERGVAAAEEEEEAAEEEAAESEALLAELRQVTRPLRSEGPGGNSGSGSPSPSRSGPGGLLRLRLHRLLHKSGQKRLRRRQGRQEAREARAAAAARVAEREAQIERWRARRAQEVDDRRREEELKAAADSVLSEVRKKQADTKRMTEILRGLEKLRKLRKEAAGRKGVCPPPAADEAFENEVQAFNTLIKKRTELYEAEERALRVMLEGEQEEERKRDMEKKEKKEKEKLLQQKREIDSKLFGDADEFPFTHILVPFTQYYLQAEYSVSSLIQIRHEWDRYLVPADHPEGHFIPPGWVLPCPPSNDVWATAVR